MTDDSSDLLLLGKQSATVQVKNDRVSRLIDSIIIIIINVQTPHDIPGWKKAIYQSSFESWESSSLTYFAVCLADS